MRFTPIESHGIIGDLHTVALVATDGTIDFLCFPDFDSPSVFASLLDPSSGGHFRISPTFENPRLRQLYLPDTNILLTRFLSPDGVAEIVDFMPVAEVGHVHDLMRRVTTVRGEVCFTVSFEPRFDYGRSGFTAEDSDGELIFRSTGADGTVLRLRSRIPLEADDRGVHREFTLQAGESMDFVLELEEEGSNRPPASHEYVSQCLSETAAFWRRWIGRSTYTGRWREMVNRSALALKLMFSRRHGSLVAAATFGLPETVGGERNWDYRYVWIRDSAFTLYALTGLGYLEEADGFMRWLEDRCCTPGQDGNGPLQVMYGIDGRRSLDEQILEHLGGYRGSSPVRVGNAAYRQLQLDIYGELLDAVYLFDSHGAPISYDLWRDLAGLVEWVAEHWQQADEGIWEVRGGRAEFLYSRLMCWVAIDRAIRIARNRSFPGPLGRWREVRDTIYENIYESFWDNERGAFMQSRGGSAIDASSLLMPMVRFISFREPRWQSHLAVLDDELVSDSLVHRYRNDVGVPDGLPGQEGTFSMCSFWFVENLARSGDLDRARFIFEKMLGYANHLGLYAEQLGPTGEHLGNFPQAFTHLGLISAALALDRALSEAGWTA